MNTQCMNSQVYGYPLTDGTTPREFLQTFKDKGEKYGQTGQAFSMGTPQRGGAKVKKIVDRLRDDFTDIYYSVFERPKAPVVHLRKKE